VLTFEQFLFSGRSNIVTADRKSSPMPPTVQVGTILMKDWPRMEEMLGLECEPYSGEWTLLKTLDVRFDLKIHGAGWNFFFLATAVMAMSFGSLGAARVQRALKRILAKVKQQHFNGLEVTGIVTRHFLGTPYVTVSAHSRHMQHSCTLDSAEARETPRRTRNGPEAEDLHRRFPNGGFSCSKIITLGPQPSTESAPAGWLPK
jgi:hypothetical protein